MPSLIGLLLIVAAVLKTHQLATEPPHGTGWLQSRWLLLLLIEYELLLGFWLISGLYQRATWWCGLATFASFAILSAKKAIAGEATCGCFGEIPTSPWISLSINLFAMVGLSAAISGVSTRFLAAHKRWQDCFGGGCAPRTARFGNKHGWLAIAGLAFAGFAAAIAGRVVESDELPGIGRRIGDLAIVEPERTVGQHFALAAYTDVGQVLARGSWIVVLYRDGCADCDSLLDVLADLLPLPPNGTRLALISVPPGGQGPSSLEARLANVGAVQGRLRDDQHWIIQTPALYFLSNQRVLRAASSLPDAVKLLSSPTMHGAASPRSFEQVPPRVAPCGSVVEPGAAAAAGV